nr:hypothetical protein [uncultured Roseateles sp.]
MQVDGKNQQYVLALSPSSRGIAFVLFESPLSLVDWGMWSARGAQKNERCIKQVKKAIERYGPDVMVIEDTSNPESKRSKRVRNLHLSLKVLAGVSNVETVSYSRATVRRSFIKMGAVTKHECSRMVAEMLPALSHRLPPKRKAWMAEDPRMSLFEAAALGLTFYGQEP